MKHVMNQISSTTNSSEREQTISPGQLCLVKNKNNITIVGGDRTVVNCNGPRGFGFVDVSDLVLRKIQFRHCGGLLTNEAVENDNSSSYFFFSPHQNVVLYFSNCSNVNLEGISIEGRYQGFAIVLANVFQSIKLTSIAIDGSMQNCSTSIASAVCVGNGIVIYQHNNLYQLSSHNLSSSIELSNINRHSSYQKHLF